MTVELVVMNRKAAAVAADSAVTVSGAGGTKIFNSASKIFAVSRTLPIAALIYDSLNVNGVPWETILKEFRNELGDEDDASLEALGERLRTFLAGSLLLESGEEDHVRAEVYAELRRLLAAAGVEGDIRVPLDEAALAAGIAARERYWREAPLLEGGPAREDVVAKHGAAMSDETRRAFGGSQPPVALVERILRVLVEVVLRWPDEYRPASRTGVVVCGFGRDEVFPALAHWEVDGVVCGTLRAKSHATVAITHRTPAHVEAFAQPGDVRAFLSGIQPQILAFLEERLKLFVRTYTRLVADAAGAGLDDAGRALLLRRFSHDDWAQPLLDEIDRFSRTAFQTPIFEMTAALPKEELALMAEALVNLTSLRKRVTAEADTVGGPVDVALITRGDGLVWIKRKAYFDGQLNPHAVERYHP